MLLPHVGSATTQVRARMAALCADNAVAIARGVLPPHCVNPRPGSEDSRCTRQLKGTYSAHQVADAIADGIQDVCRADRQPAADGGEEHWAALAEPLALETVAAPTIRRGARHVIVAAGGSAASTAVIVGEGLDPSNTVRQAISPRPPGSRPVFAVVGSTAPIRACARPPIHLARNPAEMRRAGSR